MADPGQSRQQFDSVIVSSDAVFDLFCEICSEEGQHVQAEGYCVDCSDYLCRECYKVHRKTRASRNHVLQDKAAMPQKKQAVQQQSLSCTDKAPKDICTETCEQHPEEIIKYYCRDHRSLGCSDCMTLGHRVCEGVERIRDIASDLLASQEYRTFENELKELNTKSKQIIKNSKANISNAEQCCSEANTSVRKLRDDMNKTFDQLEKDIKNETDTLKAADIQNIKAISDRVNSVLSKEEKLSSDVKALRKNGQFCKLFITMTHVNNKLESLHGILHKAEEGNSVQTYTFEPSADTQRIIISPSTLGKINMETSEVKAGRDTKARGPSHVKPSDSMSSTPTVPDSMSYTLATLEAMTAVHQKDITVRTKTNRVKCLISGCALLPDSRLVLTDWLNRTVKLVNLPITTPTVTSELNMSSSPWDLTPITADQVAVTVPADRKIAFVKMADKLRIDREIVVAGSCRGIVYGNNRLIVSFAGQVKKVEILTLDGAVERRIERDPQGTHMFKWPGYLDLAPDGQTFYVSDRDDNSITRITVDGDVLAVYRDKELGTPGGLVVDQIGRVLVCGRSSGNIHRVKSDCTKEKVVIRSLSVLRSLCYSHHTHCLYVGRECDSVTVYKLS